MNRSHGMAGRRLGGVILCALLLAAAFSGGCKPPESASSAGTGSSVATYSGSGPIQVTCTTGMVADIVKNIGGSHVEVKSLMGEGVDPHLYKASAGDVRLLREADIIFYSGLHLEGRMGDIFVSMARDGKPVFPVTGNMDEQRLIETAEGVHDPHVWFDVSLWSEAAQLVADELAKFDPPHAGDYSQSAQKYRDELAKLHEECLTRIAEIPEAQRVLVTAHDAFHYFGKAYHIEVKAIQGVDTNVEAAVKDVNSLVDFLVERRIKAVFVESSVSERTIRSLVEGCGARGHEVKIGGELFSDAMGKEGTTEGTYIGMVRHNVETIVGALK